MGSATSKIASSQARVHFWVGPIVLFLTFLINMLVNAFNGINLYKITGTTLFIGAILFFLINWYVASAITVPRAVAEKCNNPIPASERIWHGLWPAFTSVIGDPNIVTMITFASPLIIIAPLIMALLPIGPLTLGVMMLLRKYAENVPIIGTLVSIYPLTRLFDLFTSSWWFIAALFLIGYNFWSWIGGAIAATRAMNQTCG